MEFIIVKTSTNYLTDNNKKPCKEAFQVKKWAVQINTLNELYDFVKEHGNIIISIIDSDPKIEIYDEYREG